MPGPACGRIRDLPIRMEIIIAQADEMASSWAWFFQAALGSRRTRLEHACFVKPSFRHNDPKDRLANS
jgi:hypothetical protein